MKLNKRTTMVSILLIILGYFSLTKAQINSTKAQAIEVGPSKGPESDRPGPVYNPLRVKPYATKRYRA